MNTDKCIPQYLFDKKYTVHIPQRLEWESESLIESNDITIYTDGSKTNEGSGIGIYASQPNINISISMDKYTTITQAETCAIDIACKTLSEASISSSNINICSDSQATLKTLNGHCFTSKLAIESRNSIMSLVQNNNNVKLVWVPGHSNIEGNEKADSLAREGSNNPFIGPGPAIGLSYNTQRSIIRDFYYNKHKKQWNTQCDCKHSRTIINGPNNQNTKFILNKSKKDVRLITGIITGHCDLKKTHAQAWTIPITNLQKVQRR